nr:GTP cyclohydrolase I [Brucella pituitosa]
MRELNRGCSEKNSIQRQRSFDEKAFARAVNDMLQACGFDSSDDHLKGTAQRVKNLWHQKLLDGYKMAPGEALGTGTADPTAGLIIIRDIDLWGMCPHHLVPFKGVAHVAYRPGGFLHGFGGITRMVDAICHRLIYQEWATHEIAETLVSHGKARGAACIIEAQHLCMLAVENRRGNESVIT